MLIYQSILPIFFRFTQPVIKCLPQCQCNYPEEWVNKPRQSSANSLQWRHNERDGVSGHRRHNCLLNRLFRRRSKKTSKLRVTSLWGGIHRWLVSSSHKGPVTRKMFSFDDVIMSWYTHIKQTTKPCAYVWARHVHSLSHISYICQQRLNKQALGFAQG